MSLRGRAVAVGLAVAAACFGLAPGAHGAALDGLEGSCAWVADTGCDYGSTGVLAEAVVISPSQPSLTGASGTVAWSATPVPGTGTSVWTTQFSESIGAIIQVSATANTSGVVATTAPSFGSVNVALLGAVQATGTITPGIPLPTQGTVNNSITMTGAVTGVVGGGVESCALTFSGSGTDTTTTGIGSGLATCTSPAVSETCPLSYARLGVDVLITGSCWGTVTGPLAGAFELVPLDINPTTRFDLVGVAATAG